jgi:hypothetical protein
VLLSEELALVAIKPASGRHQLGTGEPLNACLAGLLIAELVLDGAVGTSDGIVVTGEPPANRTLAAAARVVAEKGPKIKAVLSHMSRGLQQHLGRSTWESAVAGLEGAGVLAPATGLVRPERPLLDARARDALVDRLRAAAAGNGPLDLRTAVLLSMTGPAQLLEVVAPTHAGRGHARGRIDHALDGTDLEPVADVVRRLIRDAAAASVV